MVASLELVKYDVIAVGGQHSHYAPVVLWAVKIFSSLSCIGVRTMYVSETVQALLSQCVPVTACGESLSREGGLKPLCGRNGDIWHKDLTADSLGYEQVCYVCMDQFQLYSRYPRQYLSLIPRLYGPGNEATSMSTDTCTGSCLGKVTFVAWIT